MLLSFHSTFNPLMTLITEYILFQSSTQFFISLLDYTLLENKTVLCSFFHSCNSCYANIRNQYLPQLKKMFKKSILCQTLSLEFLTDYLVQYVIEFNVLKRYVYLWLLPKVKIDALSDVPMPKQNLQHRLQVSVEQ